MSEKRLKQAAAFLLCLTIVSTSLSVYFYYQNSGKEKTVRALRKQLSLRDDELSDLIDELESMREQVDELLRKYKDSDESYLELFEEFEDIKSVLGMLQSELNSLTILVNLKLDYGNGTISWYNNTRVPVGTTLFNATDRIADVEYTVFEIGVFVDSINGVGDKPGRWWLWYYYDNEWKYGPVGSNQWILHDGDIVSWIYK